MIETANGLKKLQGGDYVPAAFYDEDSAFNTNAQALDTHLDDTACHISAEERQAWNQNLGTAEELASHTDDQEVHITAAERAYWNSKADAEGEEGSGNGPTSLFAAADLWSGTSDDSQATKGKCLRAMLTASASAGQELFHASLGSQMLAYGTYSCVVRLKSNYSGSAGTSFLTLKVEHVSGDVPTTLGTAAIRDSDVYRTDNYCVFAMGFDFLGPWAEGDSFRLTVEAAAAVEATVSLDYVAVNLAGATLLTL